MSMKVSKLILSRDAMPLLKARSLPGVRPSVRPSVTLVYCTQMAEKNRQTSSSAR